MFINHDLGTSDTEIIPTQKPLSQSDQLVPLQEIHHNNNELFENLLRNHI